MDLSKFQDRDSVKGVLEGKKKKVKVAGWVNNTRGLGKVKFLLLRDSTGVLQVVAHQDKAKKEIFDLMGSVTRESVVLIEGELKESKQAPGGKEIVPSSIELIAQAEELPIDVSDYSKTELPKRLDYRFLDFHRKRTQAIFKIQGEIIEAFREFFYGKSFIEMQPPSIISASSEGGTELFTVKYFEKSAYLAQSPQLYKQMVACSMGNTFSFSPVWRAEKHNTTRHVNEVRQMDIEMPFSGQMEVMKVQEEVMIFMIERVLKNCKEELSILEIKGLKVPKSKYLTYDETLDVLAKKGKIKIQNGEDLTPEAEKKLNELFPDTLVFVHTWPAKLKPFYIMPQCEDSKSKLSEGFDMLYKGLELSSGGQRIHLPELLIETLKSKKLNPKDFKSYIDSFRFGAPPHAGWSIGLERITMVICGLDNIREATMFPRDRDRLIP